MKKMISVIILIILLLSVFMAGCASEAKDYEEATTLYVNGQYAEAAAAFAALGDYEDSASKAQESSYLYAEELYKAGNFQEAIAAYEGIIGYNDAAAKIESAKIELMYIEFADVIKMLTGNEWYFNGGSDTLLNRISFSDRNATIDQVTFDGNGHHASGSNNFNFTIDNSNILLTLADGSTREIPYSLTGNSLSLGNGDYYTLSEVDAQLQGYWKERHSDSILGMSTESETNVYINNGTIKYEDASKAYGGRNGEYYYYGPYSASYTMTFGGFDTDVRNGFQFGFNIIDGEVVLMIYHRVCTPTNKLPGQNGYSFK